MRPQVLLLVALAACKASPDADATFSDPIVGAFVTFEGEEDALAAQLRALETQIYVNMEVDAKDVLKRSVTPEVLHEDDVANLEDRPDLDPTVAQPVATAFASAFELADHARIPLLEDQRLVEPTSPNHYDRVFLEGQDCWEARDCTWLKTTQDLTKEYTGGIIQDIPYTFLKDFRWVDLSVGVEDADGSRWAYVARSYDPGSYSSENGKNTIWQSYTIEVWYPRDGKGFTWADAEEGTEPLGPDAGDSTGEGALRFLSLWTETELAISEDPNLIAGTIRWGMDENYKAHEKWLDENP